MRWLTGGSFTILACVVVGCADEPGRPVSPQVDTVRSDATSAPPGHSHDSTAAEPEPETRPASPAPQIPSPRVPPPTTDLPGVPGSPIRYDTTELVGTVPEEAKTTIEGRIRAHARCARDLCGVTVAVVARPGGSCVSEISPSPVQPGGKVSIYRGRPCFDELTGTATPEETAPDHPTPEQPPETSTSGTAGGA